MQLLEHFKQQTPANQKVIASLWGMSEGELLSPQALYEVWFRRLSSPVAARFAWHALSQTEQVLLFHVLTPTDAEIKAEEVREILGIESKVFYQAITHLDVLLLLHVERGILEPYREYGDTLFSVGKELFDGAERLPLTLVQWLTQHNATDLSLLSMYTGGISLPPLSAGTSWHEPLFGSLVHSLVQSGRVVAAMKTLDWSLQYLIALAFQGDGSVSFPQADEELDLPLSSWYDLLTLAETLGVLLDTLTASGQRILFIPRDLYTECQRKGIGPLPCTQLKSLLHPAAIRVGDPLWVYNLAALVGAVLQEDIYEPVVPMMTPFLLPLLHGWASMDPGGDDRRVRIAYALALKLDLVMKVPSVMGGGKVYSRPGHELEMWSNLDLLAQATRIFDAWLETSEAPDLVSKEFQWPQSAWNPQRQAAPAREAVVEYLRQLRPGRWYPMSSLYSFLYTHYADVSHPPTYGSASPSRKIAAGVLYHRWLRENGTYFAGMVASSLRELGVLSVGYYQDPGETVSDVLLSPDLFQITPLGDHILHQTIQAECDKHALPPLPSLEVQENGDFRLTLSDTSTLYRLLPFSTFQYSGPTSSLLLTRASLQHCLALYGRTIDQVLVTLEEGIQKKLPSSNVETLRTWANGEHPSSPASLLPLAIPPPLIDAEGPLFLFDVAVLIGTLHHESLSTTERGTLPKRFVKKIRPLLRGRPRINAEQEDVYFSVLLEEACYHGLISHSQPSHWGYSVRRDYERGYDLEAWEKSDLLAQMQRVLDWWPSFLLSPWQDVVGRRFTLWGKGDWNPHAARTLLLNYLQMCKSGTWYSIDSLLDTIWEHDPYALRPDRLRETGDESSRRRKLKKEHWDLCDGELYRGILTSSLYEFGVVSLGRSDKQFPDADCICVTELGAIAVAHIHGTRIQASRSTQQGPSLIVQPTYELLLLQPDMPALYRLLAFSQIVQIGQVSKLLLTQSSIRDALVQGGSREEILELLKALSSKALPQNVVYTLEEWSRTAPN